MADFYDRPSPGESLLTEPKSRPYERPAKHSRLEEVIQFYMEKITNEEFIDNICRMLELETPVELIVESITLFFVMNHYHNFILSTCSNYVLEVCSVPRTHNSYSHLTIDKILCSFPVFIKYFQSLISKNMIIHLIKYSRWHRYNISTICK